MAKITWTAEAQRWLEDIFGYIAADNPHAAARTVNGIAAGLKAKRSKIGRHFSRLTATAGWNRYDSPISLMRFDGVT